MDFNGRAYSEFVHQSIEDITEDHPSSSEFHPSSTLFEDQVVDSPFYKPQFVVMATQPTVYKNETEMVNGNGQ